MLNMLATSGVNELLNKILGIAMPVLIAIAVVSAIIMIGVLRLGVNLTLIVVTANKQLKSNVSINLFIGCYPC